LRSGLILDTISQLIKNLIVLVIVASLLEIILPDNNYRPYVKFVVGIMIMISILNPVLQLLRIMPDLEMEIMRTQMEQFEDISFEDGNQINDEAVMNNQDLIVQEYKRSLAHEVNETVSNRRGLDLSLVELEVIEDMNKKDFGSIKKIQLVFSASESEVEREETKIIGKIDIQVGGESAPVSDWEKDVSVKYQGEKLLIKRELKNYFSLDKEQISIMVVE